MGIESQTIKSAIKSVIKSIKTIKSFYRCLLFR